MKTIRVRGLILAVLALAGMLSAFSPAAAAAGNLSAAEAGSLTFMREEEKLAHDLYLALYDAYGLPVFANIARSESQHMQAVLDLLQAYGLDDPASGNAASEFNDPTLQALYDQLWARAQESPDEALRVAALVEETDILDLQADLAQIDEVDITGTYGSLLRASGMHLRAFTGQYERQTGETYEPQAMTTEAYRAIVQTGARGMPGGTRGRGRTG